MKPFVEGARRYLLPNRDRLIFVKDGQEFLPGIQAELVPGHTLGHTAYIITSGGQTLVAIGDTPPSPGGPVGETADRICLRHRPEDVGAEPVTPARHAGDGSHPTGLSLPMARHQPRCQTG